VLAEGMEAAKLFLDLATLRVDRSLLASVDELEWRGPTPAFTEMAERLGAPQMALKAHNIARSAERRRQR
jgi:hypothetical protein